MPVLFNLRNHKSKRKALRNRSTLAEWRLWECLRHSQFCGYKFRRQQGIGKYVLDFYCPKLKLAIEVDGATHSTPRERAYDQKRQQWLESLGIQVIRFTNQDVFEGLDNVLVKLKEVCAEREQLLNHP
ncbi:MAG: endonuclease domain-containing protein [Patescibacteria group bacterium]